MKRTLYVKKTSVNELASQWGFFPILKGEVYVRSNKQGQINWSKAPIYFASELLGKSNVIVLK